MKVNDTHYDVARCYVPQEGKYENLSFIMKSLLADPIFEKSKTLSTRSKLWSLQLLRIRNEYFNGRSSDGC